MEPLVTETAPETAPEAAPEGAVPRREPRGASLDMGALVEGLADDARLGPELVHTAVLPARPARLGELASISSEPVPEAVERALASQGIERLFSHQVEGLAAVERGENVLVTTPTASGKSLVFHLPPLLEAGRGGPGRALYLFPLKALGQDQRTKFNRLAEAAGFSPGEASAAIYDGDTPRSERTKIKRSPPRVLVTNPDMLHLGLLGSWTGWSELLGELRWIVLDELHTYRGIFGSHFHHVLQRFLRLVRSQGADPVVIASSATAANAAEFAETLTGLPFHLVEESGAPRAERHVALLRPDGSPYTTTLALFETLLEAGAKTIVFTKARRITELLYSWLRRSNPELARRVASYRSGFLPEERRSIERRLFSGELDGVISTSALEMGIDVGGLDACILVGYPGSMMATWQRSGRAGRGSRPSLTALVALPDALDQYLLDHPRELLEAPCERLIVDPGNEPVTRAHVVCAAAELALRPERDGAAGGYLERCGPLVERLLEERLLLAGADGREVFSARKRPQRLVSLRGGGETWDIVDAEDGVVVGTLDGVRALHEGHPGAVYLHGGRQYLVDALDAENRHVVVRRGRLDYYTQPLTDKETAVLEVLDERRDGPLLARLAKLQVTERVVGFERKRVKSQELLSRHALDLPPVRFETVGLWWTAPRSFEDTLRHHGEDFLGALHASEHAAISLFPLLALCDRGDIGGISYPFHPQVGSGAVFVYDGHPGGVGIAARGFADLPELLARVLALVEGCECREGCPWCIQSPKCGNGNRPLDKAGAARVVRLLLGREEPRGPVEMPELDLAAIDRVEGARGRSGSSVVPVGDGATGGHARTETEPGPRPQISRDRSGRRLREEGEVEPMPPLDPPPIELSPTELSSTETPPTETTSPSDARPLTVLFDLETRRSAEEVGGWHRAHRMGVAVGVALILEEGRFEVFPEERVHELGALLQRATTVVGFNVRRFDYRVLSGYTGVDYERLVPTLDLLDDLTERLGHRLGLDHLARETLGEEKSADGLQSLEWVREGRLDLVEDYCRHDVEILRDLYLHGRREGHVRYRDRDGRVRRLAVDW